MPTATAIADEVAQTAAEPEVDVTPEYEGETERGSVYLQRLAATEQGQSLILPGGGVRGMDLLAVRQAVDVKAMSASFVIVSRGKDPNMHGNMVQIMPGKEGQGLITDAHQIAPVVLFEHGYYSPLPLGSAETPDKQYTVKLQRSKATSQVFFDQNNPDAGVIFGMVDSGTIRMASVSYRPQLVRRLKERPPAQGLPDGVEDWTRCYGGYDFLQSLLLEWSITPRGADNGSLRQALDRGHVNGQKFTQGLRMQFLDVVGEKPAWSPGWRQSAALEAPRAPTEATTETPVVAETAAEVETPATEPASPAVEQGAAPVMEAPELSVTIGDYTISGTATAVEQYIAKHHPAPTQGQVAQQAAATPPAQGIDTLSVSSENPETASGKPRGLDLAAVAQMLATTTPEIPQSQSDRFAAAIASGVETALKGLQHQLAENGEALDRSLGKVA